MAVEAQPLQFPADLRITFLSFPLKIGERVTLRAVQNGIDSGMGLGEPWAGVGCSAAFPAQCPGILTSFSNCYRGLIFLSKNKNRIMHVCLCMCMYICMCAPQARSALSREGVAVQGEEAIGEARTERATREASKPKAKAFTHGERQGIQSPEEGNAARKTCWTKMHDSFLPLQMPQASVCASEPRIPSQPTLWQRRQKKRTSDAYSDCEIP